MEKSATAQRKVLRSFKYQIDTLAQFIVRFSAYFQGVQPTLDEELKTLRRHLGGKLAFNDAEASIRSITGLMLEQTDLFRHINQQADHAIRDSVSHLRALPNLPAELSRDIQDFEQQLSHTSIHFAESLPLFERLLNLQQRALDLFATATALSDDSDDSRRLKEHMLGELRQIVQQIHVHGEEQDKLKEIEQQLAQPMTAQQLMECCLLLLKRLFQSIYQERAHTEEFVTSLHESLATVNSNLEQSLTDTQAQFQQKRQSNADMRACMADMEQLIIQSDDLSQLKSDSQHYINKLSESLASREQHDEDDQVLVLKLLGEMRDQLVQLEEETCRYKQRLENIRLQSQNDALTRLPNRHAYNVHMEQAIRQVKEGQTQVVLALVDVDFFKSINDNYGHTAGDKTLQVLAQQITRCLRHEDFLARWGGEEFALLLPDTGLNQVHTPLEKIRQRVERIPFKFKNQQVTITVSIGATSIVAQDTIESAFERADTALYQAKRNGRNQYVVIEGTQ